MAENLKLMYGIVRERGNYTETTVCTIKFLQMVFREYNMLPQISFDDFLDALYITMYPKNYGVYFVIIFLKKERRFYV